MNAIWLRAGLEQVKRQFSNILEDGSEGVIDEAIAQLDASKQEYDWSRRRTDNPNLRVAPWGYRIFHERPLRFRRSSVIKGLDLWIDLYCTALWRDEDTPAVEQVTHIRIWSDEIDYVYRPNWDAENVYTKLESGRVMLRWHFDRANPGQPGPKHHLQFGGEARDDELCWFPGILDVPRLASPPMDLLLSCQLIAANFYWDEYMTFREDPIWHNIMCRSQRSMLEAYYDSCLKCIKNDNILLDELWNV